MKSGAAAAGPSREPGSFQGDNRACGHQWVEPVQLPRTRFSRGLFARRKVGRIWRAGRDAWGAGRGLFFGGGSFFRVLRAQGRIVRRVGEQLAGEIRHRVLREALTHAGQLGLRLVETPEGDQGLDAKPKVLGLQRLVGAPELGGVQITDGLGGPIEQHQVAAGGMIQSAVVRIEGETLAIFDIGAFEQAGIVVAVFPLRPVTVAQQGEDGGVGSLAQGGFEPRDGLAILFPLEGGAGLFNLLLWIGAYRQFVAACQKQDEGERVNGPPWHGGSRHLHEG